VTPNEQAVAYFEERVAFCRREGVPLTHELVATHLVGAIDVAVAAERERCAAVAETYMVSPHHGRILAAAIRKGPVANA
jgi:hypothetical protein